MDIAQKRTYIKNLIPKPFYCGPLLIKQGPPRPMWNSVENHCSRSDLQHRSQRTMYKEEIKENVICRIYSYIQYYLITDT